MAIFSSYAPQTFLPTLLMLCFGYVGFRLYQQKQISRRIAILGGLGLAVLTILTIHLGLTMVRTIDGFRSLQPEQVKAIGFYDESLANYSCRPANGEMPPQCLALEVTDPQLLRNLVVAFPDSSAYSPNHEGARNRYLVRLSLADGSEQWFILGKGNKRNPQTAWLEFNSGLNGGWHYGVYVNPKLYRVLTRDLKLKKWR
ncbi:MAG: hypothetical protein ACAI44_09440 [Candidatus Sericytochromatia bacterium]